MLKILAVLFGCSLFFSTASWARYEPPPQGEQRELILLSYALNTPVQILVVGTFDNSAECQQAANDASFSPMKSATGEGRGVGLFYGFICVQTGHSPGIR
jgi:hypothetical protein